MGEGCFIAARGLSSSVYGYADLVVGHALERDLVVAEAVADLVRMADQHVGFARDGMQAKIVGQDHLALALGGHLHSVFPVRVPVT